MPPEPEGNLITALLGAQAVQPAAAAQAQGETAGLMSVLLLIILVLVNGFFAASEIAVITLNDNKIRKMAEEGNKKAKRVLKLTQNSSRFLSTIQIGVTLAGFLTSASAAQSYSAMLTDWLMQFIPGSRSVIDGVATVIITLILSYFSLVFGELVPKKIAMQKAEALSFRFVRNIAGCQRAYSGRLSRCLTVIHQPGAEAHRHTIPTLRRKPSRRRKSS